MTHAAARSSTLPRGAWLVAAVTAASLALLVAAPQPAAALAPVALVALGALLVTLPLRWPLLAVIALCIIADIPPNDATGTLWHAPTYVLSLVFLENLNKLVGVGALRVSGTELALYGFALLAALRTLAGQRVDRAGAERATVVVPAVLALAFVGVLWLEALGIARGGADVRQSLWQFRQLLGLPVLGGLCIYAFRGRRDLGAILGVVTATACTKVALGLYYYAAVARPLGIKPQAVTSHADSVLFVIVLVVWAALVMERPTLRRVMAAGAVWAWILVGLVINNRRTAFVTLAALLFLLFVLLPRATQRPLVRAGLWAAPLLVAYLAIATRKTTGIFAPAASLYSAISQKDASSATRDIENFNLIQTLKPHILLGTGWGHEYNEVVKAYDIAQVFPQYRYIAHNSVLWMWSIGGVAGFTALWLHLGVGAFLAARTHRFATTDVERVAAYGALAMVIAYLLQAWADMGVMSWTTTALLACSYAVTAKLAVRTGAFPARVSLFGPNP